MGLDMSDFEFGRCEKKEANVVVLQWHVFRADEPSNWSLCIKEAKELLAGQAGVYCIEGSHDARPTPGPLYIGETKRDFGERLSVVGSIGFFFFKRDKSSLESYADIWNLSIRCAKVEQSVVGAVETLLIRAHKPNYNSKDIKGTLSDDLLLLNVGRKGHLLPVVCSWYFAPSDQWPTK
ncbi:MAG: hypothetical protein KF901_16075 [Myxococcales bacterium]|nr:hypothetical protein [Myxococcales bacterium]